MTDAAELLARVETLVPSIADRAREGERLRRLPDETLDALRETGVFRALIPTSMGGHGLGLDTVLALGRSLGHADTATSWVTTFLVMHNWLLALFPPAVTAEVFGDRGYALAPAALSPTGQARPVDGGYRLSGRWSWGTGVEHADLVLVTGVVPTDGMPDMRMVMLDLDQVQIEDVWHTDGMRATGSNDVVVEDVFVPAARTLSFFDLVDGAGGRFDAPMAGYPLIPMLAVTAGAPLLGGAEGALEAFRDRLAQRVLAYSLGDKQVEKPAAQMRLAHAQTEIRAAGLLMEDAVAKLEATYGAGESLARVERSDLKMGIVTAVHRSRRAVLSLCDAAGGSIHLLDQPLQRFLRDLQTGGGHAVFDEDRTAETHGRILVGLEPAITDML